MRRSLAILIALAGAACGGGSSSNDAAADARTLNTLSQRVSAAAEAYGDLASGMTDQTSCSGAADGYDAQVRPAIGQMQGMGPGMDRTMTSMGHASHADLACGANAMMAELDRHASVACAFPTDMAPNKAEAQHHVLTMSEWADHQLVRSYEMGTWMGGMGGGGMGGGGMSTGHCVHHGDGSYTLE